MPEAVNAIQFFADRGDARLRLDQVLVRRIREISRMSRSLAQQWIEAGAVTVNGRVTTRPAARVVEGAAVAVAVPASAPRRSVPEPEAGRLDVLYEDEAMIVIDKPAGIVVHPSYKTTSGTLLNALLWRIRERGEVRPGILTRLDKDTSGVVVVALAPAGHATLQRDSAAGRIRKEYLAVVEGVPRPAAGTIRDPLGRDPLDRRRIVVTPGGMESETRFEVLESSGTMPLVCCELVTGRTHQIRVHLASLGWPIVGDTVYGRTSDLISRQALHAWRIRLLHPITRDEMTIVAPLPADMRQLAKDTGCNSLL
jgi:23S rRNA pseudouridine1911/1915/1917 synthase